MHFTVWDYALPGVIIPLVAMFILLIIVTAISRKIANKKPGSFSYLIPLLLWLVFTLGGLIISREGLKYPISALLQANAPAQVTKGQITDIYNASSPPLYYIRSDQSLQPAKMVVVDNVAYYVLHTDAEESEWVRLVWATEERIVYSLEAFTSEDIEAGLPDLELPNNNTAERENAKTVVIGTAIQYISMFLFACTIALQYPIGKRMATIFKSKDVRFDGKVVPNRYGLIYYLITVCPIFGILIGFGLTGFRGIWIIALMGGTVFFVILLKKQTTTLELQQDVLIYKKIGSVQRISVNDVCSVQWNQSSVPYNRRLIINLKTGISIDLEQENYWGLENLCRRLEQLKTGDGLRESS